jgi:hypothetical protein
MLRVFRFIIELLFFVRNVVNLIAKLFNVESLALRFIDGEGVRCTAAVQKHISRIEEVGHHCVISQVYC